MPFSRKVTVRFPADLHARLVRLAVQRATSLGDLVRSACESRYGVEPMAKRMASVQALAALDLPVDTAEEMAAESVPGAED